MLCIAMTGHSESLPRAPSIVDHRDAMHTAILGQVVGDGIVLRDTVVPHRHRPPVPAEANLKLGLVDVVEQRRQEALTVTAWWATTGCTAAPMAAIPSLRRSRPPWAKN